MSLARRSFVCLLLTLTVVLGGSFLAINLATFSTVRDGLRSSLRNQQQSIAKMRRDNELRNRRALRALSENPALKAGLMLLLSDPGSADARLTVEDQLRELSATLGYEFLAVSDPDGKLLTGVMRNGGAIDPPHSGLMVHHGSVYQVTSLPVDQTGERIALLSVGERFDFSEFNTPAALLKDGRVVASTLSRVSGSDLDAAFAGCRGGSECEVKVSGSSYLSLEMEDAALENGYVLRSLLNLDAALAPVRSVLTTTFIAAGAGAFVAALILSAWSSRVVAGPISQVVKRLRQGEATGSLPEFDPRTAPVREVRRLMETFNEAGAAIREGRERLHRAYVGFVGSLANALDARDPYTAGHSRRVSEYSCAVGQALGLDAGQLENLRIGALLHDIGKIGVPDTVLQKPGKLTDEEFRQIREHPETGRRILQDVPGFAPYLSTVELHHENWDGSGYPRQLRGEETPMAARIVHVADAYDAMTSDRPYRRGMSSDEAVRILEKCSGTQFDSEIVTAFARLVRQGGIAPQNAIAPSLLGLAASVQAEKDILPQTVGTEKV